MIDRPWWHGCLIALSAYLAAAMCLVALVQLARWVW